MKTTYSITEAQAKLPMLVRETAGGAAVAIQRHGETAAYLISKERLEGILETLELQASPEAIKAVAVDRRGRSKFLPLDALDE
jgi:PHD/YefM family antitoxin component YafN of YafNO toxin-antitoxin module